MSGETHIYLGRQYRLKIKQASRSSVKLIGRYFQIQHPTPKDSEAIAGLLQDWYIEHGKAVISNRIQHWTSECRPLALAQPPDFFLRRMTRRWGSCSKKGTITLNVDLVKVPLASIDYVIVHELSHLKIHNHSPAFYKLLTRCMPDWEQRKRRLDHFQVA